MAIPTLARGDFHGGSSNQDLLHLVGDYERDPDGSTGAVENTHAHAHLGDVPHWKTDDDSRVTRGQYNATYSCS